jgi:hypothetical protein
MLAGTGAGMAAKLKRAMLKFVVLLAGAIVIGLLLAVAIGYFGFAVYFVLAPDLGPAGSAAAVGGVLIVVSAILALACRLYTRQHARPVAPRASDLGGSLGAAALGASLGAGPDIRGALGRNAMTVLLAAFIAGMVMNNRR